MPNHTSYIADAINSSVFAHYPKRTFVCPEDHFAVELQSLILASVIGCT